MDDIELTCKYLMLLLDQYSGTMMWKEKYEALQAYTNNLTDQEREKYYGIVYDFIQKYKNKG